jgi:predicted pyridoxine 5'-phosphate oxidase superfamily flavin-nucleotide-binding protein
MMGRPAFHAGEREVQRRAGVERVAATVGRNILPSLSPDFAAFLERQPLVVVGGRDARERVWASLIVGGVGFARALDDQRVLLAGDLPEHDPLARTFEPPGGHVGILALEPDTRSRIRVNGRAQRTVDGNCLTVEEAFGNCPKYIQRRLPAQALQALETYPSHRCAVGLDPGQANLIRAADTFFIASAHPDRGADASHRGGSPGFVEVDDAAGRLRFPDYPGNRMFQTLGNITVDPRVGLLFIDWERGTSVQLTGRARIVWARDEVSRYAGAERLVDVEIEAVYERRGALPARWELIEPSRLNPPVRTGEPWR